MVTRPPLENVSHERHKGAFCFIGLAAGASELVGVPGRPRQGLSNLGACSKDERRLASLPIATQV